jgi:hypothetical protein
MVDFVYYDSIFNSENIRTKEENFTIFNNLFGSDNTNVMLTSWHLITEDKAILNMETMVRIMCRYSINKNVLDLIDYVESTGNTRFTYLIDGKSHFHFSPNMFVKFIEYSGNETTLKQIAMRTLATKDNESLYEDILFCSILCASISSSFILDLFSMDKFCMERKMDLFWTYSQIMMNTKKSLFMCYRIHIIHRQIPSCWSNIIEFFKTFGDCLERIDTFINFINKINPNLNNSELESVETLEMYNREFDELKIKYFSKKLFNAEYNPMDKCGYVFPCLELGEYGKWTSSMRNVLSFCYAGCARLTFREKSKFILMPIYIDETLNNVYKTNRKFAKIILSGLILSFLNNDYIFSKNMLLNLTYNFFSDTICLGEILRKMIEKKMYDYCESIFKYHYLELRSSYNSELILELILEEYDVCSDDEKIQIKSLCISIVETGIKIDDKLEEKLNNIGIITQNIKWSWRWILSDTFDPNSINDLGESLFQEAYRTNRYYYLKKIIKHRKFKPMTSPKNIIKIVLSDDSDIEYKKELLGMLLQTSIILKSEQVKKITELGIDVYKTLQKRICMSDTRIETLEDNSEKLVSALKLSEERNEEIQERLKIMERREYKIISFLQLMCAQYVNTEDDINNNAENPIHMLQDIM